MSALGPKGPRQWVLVPGKGIEPLTRSLQGCRSATELDRQIWSIWRGSNPHLLVGSQT